MTTTERLLRDFPHVPPGRLLAHYRREVARLSRHRHPEEAEQLAAAAMRREFAAYAAPMVEAVPAPVAALQPAAPAAWRGSRRYALRHCPTQDAVLAALHADGPVAMKELAESVGCSPGSCGAALYALKTKGLARPVRRGVWECCEVEA